MTETTTAALAQPVPSATNLQLTILAALALLALSDWLFWSQGIGLNAAIWIAAVSLAVVLVNWNSVDRTRAITSILVTGVAIAPVLETINPLSILVAFVGLAVATLLICQRPVMSWPWFALEPVKLLGAGPFRMIPDLGRAQVRGERFVPARINFAAWIVPVLFSALFLLLFASANPMIEKWVAALNLTKITTAISFDRVLFWFVVLSVVWGFLRARTGDRTRPSVPRVHVEALSEPQQLRDVVSVLFSPAAILRALILFNLLFLVQTGLDIHYLWRGTELPDGITYANYAHRGAYPLMLTAALAALFVILSFGPGRDLENFTAARLLVFAWILQNVLLVSSAMQRLNIYVEVYALSYWRLAAFIWMGLVAIGLLLVLVRIATQRSNAWLVGTNLAVTVAVLYLCCFLNFPSIIANYNVDHSFELSGTGAALDVRYLERLGPNALPALIRFSKLDNRSQRTGWPAVAPRTCKLQQMLAEKQGTWRTWIYRDHRLLQFLRKENGDC